MLKKIKDRKEKKIKTFLFFLLLATIFWMLTKYSNEYTQSIISKVEYINLPEKTILSDSTISEISFDVVANGFEFLLFKLKKPTITIDVSRFYSKETNQSIVSNNELKKLITQQLNKNILVRNISVTELHVFLKTIQTKKIPVKPLITIQYKPGFKNTSKAILQPDSIVVQAPKEVLDTLKFITTQTLNISDVDKSISQELLVNTPDNATITLENTKVWLQIPVEETIQKTIQLPLLLKNVPKSLQLKIIPERVSITYTTTVSNFNTIDTKIFKIESDYKKRNQENNTLHVNLVSTPDNVFDVTINPKSVNYLLVK